MYTRQFRSSIVGIFLMYYFMAAYIIQAFCVQVNMADVSCTPRHMGYWCLVDVMCVSVHLSCMAGVINGDSLLSDTRTVSWSVG